MALVENVEMFTTAGLIFLSMGAREGSASPWESAMGSPAEAGKLPARKIKTKVNLSVFFIQHTLQ